MTVHSIAETEVAYKSATDADAVKLTRATELSLSLPKANMYQHTMQRPIAMRDKPRVGAVWAEMNFKQEIAGSGTAGTAPSWAVIMEATGCKSANDPGVSELYTFDGYINTNFVGVDFEMSLGDGIKQLCGSSVCDARFNFLPGEPVELDVTAWGLYTEPTEAALAYTLATSAVPIVAKNLAVVFAGKTTIVKSASIFLGVEPVSPRLDIVAVNGVQAPVPKDTQPGYEIVIEYPAHADINTFNQFTAETAAALVIPVGTVAGNILTFTMDGYMSAEPIIEEDEGIAVVRYQYAIDTQGSDKFKLMCT